MGLANAQQPLQLPKQFIAKKTPMIFVEFALIARGSAMAIIRMLG
jgi:hypothetical protein